MKYIPTILTSCLAVLTVVSFEAKAEAIELKEDFSQKGKPATIKVLLSKGGKEAILEVKGRYQVFNPANNLPITSPALGKRGTVTIQETGMKWDDNLPPGIFEMRIVPQDSQATILVNGIEYRGCIEFYLLQNSLHAVNEVDVESYLKSILTEQFPVPLSNEAMNAVAIVERTNAYYFISKNPRACWHVEAQDGGYLGYGITLQNLHVDRAVDSTRHVVLTYQSQPFATTWTKNSAGKTASYTAIFRKSVASPEGVAAPLAAKDREKYHWSFSVPKQQLAKTVGLKSIAKLDLYTEKQAGKVYAVKLADNSSSQDINFFKLQRALGKNKLMSNDFTMQIKGDQVVFSGFGEGSGVGLCLYSAEEMVKKGANAAKILNQFFPGTKIENIRALPDKSSPKG